ncbi:AraC family transcriptional regulator [Sedimenticola sp.]|uniref:AraC family transcriptional regulator n=1 Tax=Sedimenticola sp. TaxID=1940285 RepID=UPI003D0FC3BD
MTQENSLAAQLLALMPEPGVWVTDVPHMSLVRCDEAMTERAPVMYEPCIYIVVQGRKVAHLGDESFVYDALNYLVLSVPLPLDCQVLDASRETPYLAVKIGIDTQLLDELSQEIDAFSSTAASAAQRGIFVSSLGEDIKSTLGRLLSYVGQPSSARVLGSLAIKELLFHVLHGAQGDLLRAFAYRDRHNFQIARVINYIQSNYSASLEVAALADRANMSPSSFHSYFKAVTSSTPIQYIKAIRLHEARRRMLYDNQSASDAAYHVGYASPSQFSREYRRMFGVPPSEDRLVSEAER